MAVVETRYFGVEGWRKAIKAAGQYIIDNADSIIAEGERCRGVNISLKGIEYGCLPVLAVEKEYNVLEMMEELG